MGWRMKAYDSHCNLVLADVEETVYIVNDEEEDDGFQVSSLAVAGGMGLMRGMTDYKEEFGDAVCSRYALFFFFSFCGGGTGEVGANGWCIGDSVVLISPQAQS